MHAVAEGLERIQTLPNWPTTVTPKQFLVLGAGPAIDQVADCFVSDTQSQQLEQVKIGLVWEANRVPGDFVALRIQNTDREVHHAVTDLTLRRQGNDLFVRIDTTARSALSYLRSVTLGTLVFCGWTLVFAAYLSWTGTYDAIVVDYARKYNPQESVQFAQAIKLGYRINADGDLFWPGPGNGIGFLQMAREDPALLFGTIAMPAGFLAGIIGGAVYMIPRAYFFLPCKAMGWPTPEEFDSLVTAHASWVENMLSYVLFQRFGVGQDQIMAS